jgi:glycosyltransferase involved in cell wall biosynthesis
MNITKFPKSVDDKYDFTVLIPTWNNLGFIQNCLQSVQKNSSLKIQPIVIINEGKDGSLDWFVKQNNIDFIHAAENIGICYALNIARSLAKADYIVYANDDMYFLPDWDRKMMDEIKFIGHHHFMLSATMIEPDDTGNACVVVADYGRNLESFEENKLLSNYKNLVRNDWKGSTWPPNVVHKDLWDLVGGLSIEFSPGMYSDPDFSMKLYQAGVRHFKGLGSSLVYHFGSKSTKRVKKNKGRNTFILKWGVTAGYFFKEILQIGKKWDKPTEDSNIFNKKRSIISKIKRTIAVWRS